jgi:hypothetical protein
MPPMAIAMGETPYFLKRNTVFLMRFVYLRAGGIEEIENRVDDSMVNDDLRKGTGQSCHIQYLES